MVAIEVIVTIFCYFNLAYAKPHQDPWDSLWKAVIPGELLKSLDAITSTHLEQPVQVYSESKNDIRFKRRIDKSSIESLEENIPYDYDKAYEEFVKKYFEKSVNDALSASDSVEQFENEQHDTEINSGEELMSVEDDEPISEASKTSTKTEKCKNIVRGKQNCFLCENTKNGATSESCLYNKESKPISYEFEKHKNYRMHRATPKNLDYEVQCTSCDNKNTNSND